MMRNVLQVTDFAAPYRGNFMESLQCLDNELRALGCHNVYVFPARAKGNLAAKWIKELTASGYPTYYLTGQPLKDIGLLCKIVRKHQIGLIHRHYENIRIDVTAYFASLLSHVKVIRHFRSQLQSGSSLKRLLQKHFIFRRWDLVGVSDSLCNDLRREFPRNKCRAVINAIYFKRLDDCERLSRSQFGISEESVLCFMMGYDYRIKGVDIAVDAIAELRKRVNVELMISIASNVEHVSKSIETQLGGIPAWIKILPPRNDVGSYYRMSDIFISASRQEGFCFSLVEAAYCGTMVVASRIPAQSDLKIPHAFWFRTEDSSDLRANLEKAIQRKDSFTRELMEAADSVQRSYDLKVWVERIIEIYRQALCQRDGSPYDLP